MASVSRNRRVIVRAGFGAFVAASTVASGLAQQSPPLRNVAAVLKWLDAIDKSPNAKTTEGWPLPQVLEHLAQSVLFSLNGFPQPKPAWFQASAGAAAFAVFKFRGRMTHGLTEPIPGAPALGHTQVAQGTQSLRTALLRFEAHTGALKSHFAYGNLSKADYALAHVMHVNDHLSLIRMG
jgi:hypothetical protein